MKRESVLASEKLQALWEATSGAWPGYEPLRGDRRCDVAIVGGGFAGVASALALAERGVRVTLIEADRVGHRAAGRNGGQVVPGLKPRADRVVAAFGEERGRRMLDFAHGAADHCFGLIAQHRIDCDPTRNGWIQGAFSARAREDLRRRAEINARYGADVAFLDEERVARLTGSRYHHGGMIERAAGAVNPLKLVRGLARAAVAAGATVHEHTRALGLERDGSGWRIASAAGRLEAGRVILATDAHTGRLWPRLTQSMVTVCSGQIATDPLPAPLLEQILPSRAGVSETRRITYYYRIDPAGRFVIGGRGPSDDDLGRTTARRIMRGAVERFPQLQAVRWAFGWAGRVSLTRDDLPHLHELAPGLWSVAGYGGRGVAIAVRFGTLLADLASGQRAADAPYPVTPLRRMPFYPLRQPAAAVAITVYRIKDRLGLPS